MKVLDLLHWIFNLCSALHGDLWQQRKDSIVVAAMSLFKAAMSLIWSAVYFRAATGFFQSCSRIISELLQVYFRAAAGLLRSCSDTLRS